MAILALVDSALAGLGVIPTPTTISGEGNRAKGGNLFRWRHGPA
jgi:hypothetical protein